MALIVKDRVKESTTTTGTADFTLGGAASGFQTFAIIGNTNTTYYAAVDQATGDWEVGVGTYSSTGPTLTRTTVLESSNSGSKVVFAAGSKDVFCTYPAERSVYLDAAGSAVSVLDIGTLGVSTANITTANITAGTITTTPVNNTDIVNKAYADAIASGIHFHEAVSLATTAALPANTYNNGTSGVGATLTGNANGALSIDSTLTVATERVLIKNEANGSRNGVYVVTQVGSAGTPYILTRATDFDSVGTGVDQIDEGDFFLVTNGVANLNTAWVQQTAPPITIGTTALVFQQFSAPITYTAGTGLSESPSYTFNIANIGTAGTYGSASSVPVFVTNAQGQVTSVTPTGIAITSAAVSGLAASATTDTTNAVNITSGTLPSARLNGSYTGITGVGTLTTGTWNASAIGATFGGTGLTSYVQGDLLYATSSTTVGRLADVVAGNALISGGVGGDPAWGKIGLQTHIDGTLLVANGGTGATTLTGYVYGNGTGAFTASTSIPNAATTATSANTASAIVARDGSGNFSAGTITAALSGNATTATSATSATTAGNVTGVVAFANGGTGATTRQDAMDALAGAVTSGQYLRGNGTDVVMSAIQAADVPTLNQNTTGTAANVTGTVAVANGGTGATTAANALTNLGAYAASNPSAFINQAGARTAVSFTAGSGAYNNTTGVFTIPTNTNQLTNGAGFLTSAVTSVGTGTGLTGGTITTTGTISLANTAVTAGSYTSTNITVDAQGRITAASNGSSAAIGTNTQVAYNNAGTMAGSANLTFNGTNLTCGGTITSTSDESLKTNWRNFSAEFVEQLAKVKSGTYDRVDTDLTQDGVSAQSLQPLLPFSVLAGEDGKLSVSYGNAALVSVIELAKRVVDQDARIAKLEALVAQLTKGNTP